MILFEICEKRPFQKCMGWGGGRGHIFEHRANGTMYTKHALHSLDHSLWGVRIVVIVAPLHTGWDPIPVYLSTVHA